MNKYETPNFELIELETKDIVCTSGGGGGVTLGGWGGDNDGGWEVVQ